MRRVAPQSEVREQPMLSAASQKSQKSVWSAESVLERLFDDGVDEVADKIDYKQHIWSLKVDAHQNSESDESEAEKHIVPITLSSACQRLGHFLDIWFTDAAQAIDVIQLDHDQSPFPLSGLFKPEGDETPSKWPGVCTSSRHRRDAPLDKPDSSTARRSSSRSVSSAAAQAPVKRVVKAPMARELRSLRRKVQDEMHVDDTRKWSNAILINPEQEGDEIQVEWEEFSTFEKDGTWNGRSLPEDEIQSEHWKVNRRKIVEKERAIAENDVIKVLTEFFLLGRQTRYCLVILVVLAIVFEIPDVVMLQRQTLCEERNDITEFLCGEDGYQWADSFLDTYFCYVAGLIGITTTSVLAVLLPFWYMLLYRMSPRRAKVTRKIFVNIAIDPFVTKMFSDVHGWIQMPLLVVFSSLYVSGFLVAVVRMNGGLFPLAHLLVHELSRVMNVVLGEPLGVSRMRALRILSVLAEHAKANSIDISFDQLHEELVDFLSTPPNAGVVEVSLPFLALMAHAIHISKPLDSVRMRRFVVSRAFAEYDHLPQGLAKLSGSRKDVIVDLFASTCSVPTCQMEGEKWREKGRCAFPWHFALVLWKVPEIEMKLRLFKLRPGDGCFTWRSTRNGLWATREAEDMKLFIDYAKKYASKREGASIALSMMILDHRFQDVQEIKPLLDAKADVNLNNVGETALFRAIRQGKAAIAKELVLYRADLNLRCARHGDKSPMQLISDKDECHFKEFREFVEAETRAALERHKTKQEEVAQVVFIQVDSTKVEEFKLSPESLRVKFPEGLQPFRLRKTDTIKAGQLSRISEGEDYANETTMTTTWKVESTVIRSLFGQDSVCVTMSKISQLTLPLEVRKRIDIPNDVEQFAWCHPVRDERICLVHSMVPDHNNPDFSFLLGGGFVYFAEEDSVITPKLILAPLLSNEIGRYLTFKPAEKWSLSAFLAEANVHKDNFNDITFAALRGAGYRMYAWLQADSWHRQKKRGGFAYIASHVVSSLEKLLINISKYQMRNAWEKLRTNDEVLIPPPPAPPVPPPPWLLLEESPCSITALNTEMVERGKVMRDEAIPPPPLRPPLQPSLSLSPPAPPPAPPLLDTIDCHTPTSS